MARNLTHKILEAHLVEGRLVPGEEIGIRIAHTLLQDATGTVAMLEFEALGLDSVRTELSAQYVGPQYSSGRQQERRRSSVSSNRLRRIRDILQPTG